MQRKTTTRSRESSRPASCRPCPPTLRVALPYSESDGDAACDVMAATGMRPDEEQRAVMRDWLAWGGDGKYAHTINVLEAPRQNLKSFLLRARTLFGALVGERILFTAHNYDTTAEMRDEMYRLFGSSARDRDAEFPWLNRRVSRVGHTNGHEYIKLKNGGAVYFSTRTKSAKRGFTVDAVIMDEAQELQEVQAKALLATASAAPLKNPQFIYAGTPPVPGCFGDSFQPLRDRIADGQGGRACLNEWSATDIEGFRLEDAGDKRYWYMTNIALGTRIEESTVAAEFASYSDPLSFAQERLGYWLPREQVNSAVKRYEWEPCAVEVPPHKEGAALCYAVKFSPDGDWCAVAVCFRADGHKPHVELAEFGPMAKGVGTYADWVAKRWDRADRVVVDGKAAAEAMVQALAAEGRKGKRLVQPRASEVADACAMLKDAARSGNVTHFDQPVLNQAVCGCAKRKIGSSGGWGFEDSAGDGRACVAEAAALALWAVSGVKRHRGAKDGKVRIGG